MALFPSLRSSLHTMGNTNDDLRSEPASDALDPVLDSTRSANEQLSLLGHKAELKRTHTFWSCESR